MNRGEWAGWTGKATVHKRAGGRRRYNAQRRRRAEARRAAIDEWLGEHPAAMFFPGGLPGLLAPAFGVHPSTIWRDLQVLLRPARQYSFYGKGKLFFTLYREYPGGPVVGLEDPDGNEIRGKARRDILKRLPRYFGRRR